MEGEGGENEGERERVEAKNEGERVEGKNEGEREQHEKEKRERGKRGQYIPSMVIGSGAEHVTQRVPGQTPHKAVMRRLHSSNVPLVATVTDKQEEKTCKHYLED